MQSEESLESVPQEETAAAPEAAPAVPTPAPAAAVTMPDETANVRWEDLPLSPEALESIRAAGFEKPSPVQAKALAPALEGKNLIASAQTGTGKTLAFAMPIIERLSGRSGTFALVLAPTREIALQIHAVFEQFGKARGVTSISVIGGTDLKQDAINLHTYPSVIVGTPGRICDHIERGNMWLEFIEHVVLDEADRMLDMGFSKQLNQILNEISPDAQFMLFSATIPPDVQSLAKRFLAQGAERISIGRPMTAAKTVEQKLVWMKDEDKNRMLRRLFEDEKGTIIVFVRTKDGASRLWRRVHSWGVYDATVIHSDLAQAHREKHLEQFKKGEMRILIATDVVGRGIHVDNVSHVINFDLPLEPEDYVHRIGRTGRAELTGKATSFATPRDRKLVEQIERTLKTPIPTESGPAPTTASDESPREERGGRGGRGARGGRGRRGEGARDENRAAAPAGATPPVSIPTPREKPAPVGRPKPRSERDAASPPVPLRAAFKVSGDPGLRPFSPDDLASPFVQEANGGPRLQPRPLPGERPRPGGRGGRGRRRTGRGSGSRV